jgi:putative polymerase
MSTLSNPYAAASGQHVETQASQQILAVVVVFAAVLFNLVLCFVNTTLFNIGANVVIGVEMTLLGLALGLIWYRGYGLYTIVLLGTAYFFIVMLARSEFDAKIVRDLLIPIIFFFVGSHLGSLRSADRLVTVLIIVALSGALFEWLALNTFLHYFDVIHYYQARGTEQNLQADAAGGLFIRGSDTNAGLYINGTRFEERTLLPFLGVHRVSGIFLEPVSVGNFGVIAFAWVLLRDRSRIWILVAKTAAIATILVLADARFGCYLSVFTLIVYLVSRAIRPTMLFLGPFLALLALVTYAGMHLNEPWDNTLAGRLLSSGNSLLALDSREVLGLRNEEFSEFFRSGLAGDSGYGYVLAKVGLVGMVASWALFTYAPVFDEDAWRFKTFIAFYIVFLLAISASSLFSIKTAALLWFLHGTLNNPQRSIWASSLAYRGEYRRRRLGPTSSAVLGTTSGATFGVSKA